MCYHSDEDLVMLCKCSHSLNLIGIANALNHNTDAFDEDFVAILASDGRWSNPIAQRLATTLPFKIKGQNAEYNMDSFIIEGEKHPTGFSCLNDRVLFQDSRRIGTKRNCSDHQLFEDLSELEFYVVCDVSNSAKWDFFMLSIQGLLNEIRNDDLKPAGWSSNQFYSYVKSRIKIRAKVG
jgi:hypothetical protein